MLCVLEAGDVYPSGFIRGLIYRDWFARAGYDVRYVSRLAPSIARLSNRPPRWMLPLIGLGLGQLLLLLQKAATAVRERILVRRARGYDVVYMSKVTSYRFVSRLGRKTAARLVLDFGDALWLPRWGVSRFPDLLATVDAVTTDNEHTASFVRRHNSNCTVVPDAPQVEWFDERRASARRGTDGEVTLGWIGTPGTVYNLYVIWEALERLFARKPNLHLRIVGVGHGTSLLPPFEGVRFSVKPHYTQAEMIDEVLRMDIGLFPLQNVQASVVRGVLKAAVYMSGEVAVVCSAVGQNVELIDDGVNGMLAGTQEEWERKIEQLVDDRCLRARIAAAGLRTVRERFTVQRSFDILRTVLDAPPAR